MVRTEMPAASLCDCRPGKSSLFHLIDEVWKDPQSAPVMHRICTMMRLMGVQCAVREPIDKHSQEWPRISKEFKAIRARLAADVEHLKRHMIPGTTHTTVARTLLVEASSYLAQIAQQDNMGKRYDQASLSLIQKALRHSPDVWLTEITEPDLFVGNRAKVMDVLTDPKAARPTEAQDMAQLRQAIIGVRLPSGFITLSTAGSPPMPGFHEDKLKFVEGHLPIHRLGASA